MFHDFISVSNPSVIRPHWNTSIAERVVAEGAAPPLATTRAAQALAKTNPAAHGPVGEPVVVAERSAEVEVQPAIAVTAVTVK